MVGSGPSDAKVVKFNATMIQEMTLAPQRGGGDQSRDQERIKIKISSDIETVATRNRLTCHEWHQRRSVGLTERSQGSNAKSHSPSYQTR